MIRPMRLARRAPSQRWRKPGQGRFWSSPVQGVGVLNRRRRRDSVHGHPCHCHDPAGDTRPGSRPGSCPGLAHGHAASARGDNRKRAGRPAGRSHSRPGNIAAAGRTAHRQASVPSSSWRFPRPSHRPPEPDRPPSRPTRRDRWSTLTSRRLRDQRRREGVNGDDAWRSPCPPTLVRGPSFVH